VSASKSAGLIRISDLGTPTAFRDAAYVDNSTLPLANGTASAGTSLLAAAIDHVHPGTAGGITQLTGDVLAGPGTGSQVATIASNAVSNAKLAQMAAFTLKGNNTAGTANALDLTATQVKTLLAISASDVSGLAAIATSGSATDLVAGTLPAGRFPALTGDLTTAAGGLATTLATVNANVGSWGDASHVGSFTVNGKGLVTAASSVAISIAAGAVSGLATIATSGSASDLVAGTIPAARQGTFTGDITTPGGSYATTLATVNSNVGSFGDVAHVAQLTVNGKGLVTAVASVAISIAAGAVSGLAAIATSGSASDLVAGTLPAGRFPALTGDITTVAGALATTLATVNSNTGTFGDASHVGSFTVNGKGLITAASSVSIAIAAGAVSGLATIATSGSGTDLTASSVTNAKLANMAAHTYKGNNTGSSATPIDVTSTQLTADLNLFTSLLQGLTPASGGGTTNFLRADGTWAAPAGGGGGGVDYNAILMNDPATPTINWTPTYSSGLLMNETWANVVPQTIKTVDYTYSSGLVSTQIVKAYDTSGVVQAQITYAFIYSSGVLTGYTMTRDVGLSTTQSIDTLLEVDPVTVGVTLTVTYTSGAITFESWTNTATTNLIKTISYTYSSGLLTQERRKVYDTPGTTIVGQITITPSYSGSILSGAVSTRDI